MPRANRIVSGSDYRRVVRRGRRTTGRFTVVSSTAVSDGGGPRFGFIITKKVGGAVVRNRVRRRLKAVGYSLIAEGMPPRDIVIRALPAAVTADWSSLRSEISSAALGSTR